jgi:hypothetical protein
VEGDIDNLRVTKYGKEAYRFWGLETYRGRAYMWNRKSFILPNDQRVTPPTKDSNEAPR